MTLPGPASARRNPIAFLALFASYTLFGCLLYRPAFDGGFLSDDFLYLLDNPYVQRFSWSDLGAILDPWGVPAQNVAQYVPVDLLLHGLEWQIFGANPLGYHVVNVVGHALVTTLLVALLRSASLSWRASLLGGTFFLVHPANVEAVAWMSQLKSIAALALALAALLLASRRPLAATGAFVLSVLSKASGLLVLPVLAVRKWIGRAAPGMRWIALWTLLVALYTLPQLAVAQRSGLEVGELAALPFGLRLRETLSLIGRYSVIAATSIGVSVQHEPAVPTSWLDSWVIAGLVVVGVLAARTLATLLARREEAAWWTFAGAGFAPVSQVLPMVFPMADRYLYFILPGVIGALLLAVSRPSGLGERWRSGPASAIPFALAVAGLSVLAVRAHEHAAVFSSGEAYVADAVAHYPDGIQALLLHAAKNAEAGNREATLEAVDELGRRGFNSVLPLENDPHFEFVRDDPRFQAVVQAGARFWTERIRSLPDPTPKELMTLARAYLVQQQPEPAIAALREALGKAGPYREAVLAELREAEAAEVRARAGSSGEEKMRSESSPR